MAGRASIAEVLAVFQHLDELEDLLDEADEDDVFGTEGWRHRLGIDD